MKFVKFDQKKKKNEKKIKINKNVEIDLIFNVSAFSSKIVTTLVVWGNTPNTWGKPKNALWFILLVLQKMFRKFRDF